MHNPRIIFFGMEGLFSRAPLLELLHAQIDVRAVIVPRPAQSRAASTPIRLLPPAAAHRSDVPLFSDQHEKNIIRIAWDANIQIYEVDRFNDSQTLATLHALRADVICVTCFPFILPQLLITNYVSLNLHPSLLPSYRGPSPLFWIFHDGLENAGVTLHLIDEHADTGDIVAQEQITLPDGIRYTDAERICSEQGARLMVEALRLIESEKLSRSPQTKIAAPRAPSPSEKDYIITPAWSVRRAFNFIRGMGEGNLKLEIGNSRFVFNEAIEYTTGGKSSEAKEKIGEHWKIRFADGTLLCSIIPISNL